MRILAERASPGGECVIGPCTAEASASPLVIVEIVVGGNLAASHGRRKGDSVSAAVSRVRSVAGKDVVGRRYLARVRVVAAVHVIVEAYSGIVIDILCRTRARVQRNRSTIIIIRGLPN